jgi:uncharacterized protein involved in exopolysaccharide biosynthesis
MLERTWSGTATQSLLQREREREFISFADIIGFVRSNLLSIGIFVTICVLVAYAYVVTTEPTYTAKTEVLISPKLPTSLQQQQPAEINLSLDTAQIESQIVVLRSEKIAKLVIDKLDLLHNPKFVQHDTMATRLAALEGLVRTTFGLSGGASILPAGKSAAPDADDNSPEAEFKRARRAMDTFTGNLDVGRVGVSYALDISFKSRDPDLSAEIANATADAYIREQLDTRVDEAENGLQWLEDRIEQIRAQMNEAAIAAQMFRAKHDYSIGARTLSSADGPSADKGEKKGITLDELEATADSYKKMYESFLQAFTTSANQQPVADARIITLATPPQVPSGPRRKLILAFGAVSGIMLGVGLAFARSLLDMSIRSPQQVRDELGLACLGELVAVAGRWGGFGRFDEVARTPGSAFSRGIRGIKAAVTVADLDRPARFIGITSVSPGEGKSMLGANLATSWAMSGMRTLLIDADVDHSVISRRVPHNPDQSAGQALEWVEQVKLQIAKSPQQAFEILPSTAVERFDLLAAKNLQKALAALDRYEMIVVDLPPLTSGNQGLAMASQLDGVLLALQWGTTSRDMVMELVHALVMAKASIIGIVLTRVRKSSNRRFHRRARQIPR